MSQQPTVSVVMPVYNTSRYVAKTIESILAQTLTDFEFLILNDGSTDDSLKVLQRYAAQDQRIRLISRDNRGIPYTRNELLHQAQSDLIAAIDSDDIALPERLATQVAFLQNHPEVVCVGSSYQFIDEAGRLLLTRFAVPETDDEIQQLLLSGCGGIHQPTVMFRRSIALAVGGYDETMTVCEDLDLWLRMGEAGKLANLKDSLTQYRLHQHSTTEQNLAMQLELSRKTCERAWKRRGIAGQFAVQGEWRPSNNRASQHHFSLLYGWWAFSSRQRSTALFYGQQAIALNPFSFESWKLFFCAAMKALPEGDPL